MKHQLIGLIVFAAFLTSCETTDTANNPDGKGTQESKRLAALQEQQRQTQRDEGQQNLWSAQENILNRDSNPMRSY